MRKTLFFLTLFIFFALSSANAQWISLGGQGKDVALQGNNPWALGTDNGIYSHSNAGWQQVPGGGRGLAIALGPNKVPWVIGTDNTIYQGTGTGWTQLPGGGRGKDIAVAGNGQPWIIGMDDGIYHFENNRWIPYPGQGRGKAIAVSPQGVPFVIGMDDGIYRGTGSGLVQLPGAGKGKDIAVDSSGIPWIIGTDQRIYRHDGTKWNELPGGGQGVRIAIDQPGVPLVLGTDRAIWQYGGGPIPSPQAMSKPVPLPAGQTTTLTRSGAPVLEPWDALWKQVWNKTNSICRIEAAPTVMQNTACQGDLGLGVLVENTILAIRAKKYGDAVRWMAQFQDRSLCLTPEGARGVDFALGVYAHLALTRLPRDQQMIAVQGTYNLALLAFNQVRYTTKRSWWQGVAYIDKPQITAVMSTYPITDLGLWFYDFEQGRLDQLASKTLLDGLLASSGVDLPKGGGGVGGGSTSGGGGGGAGGGMNIGGMPNAGSVSCLVAAAGSFGPGGMVTCMNKTLGGFRPTVNLNPLVDARVSVRDPQCAVSDTTSADGGTPPTDKEKKEPEKKATVKEVAEAVKDIAVEVVLAPLDQTPPVISDLKPLVSEKGAEAAGTWLETSMDMTRKKELATNGDDWADEWDKWKKMSKKEKADYFRNKDKGPKRTAPDADPGGGGCDKASNMARMFQAAYNCTQGGGSTQVSGGRPLATPRPIDPAVQPGSRPAVLLACITQGGSLVRTSSNDPKCAAMRCVQGQMCPCEPAGGLKAQAGDQVAPPQLKAGPDCMGDDCKPPGSVKPGTGSPKPTGGGPIDPRGGPPTKPAGK